MIDVATKQSEPMTAAFLNMVGPYDQMPDAFGVLYGWIERHGYTPAGPPRAVYLTDPAETPAERAAWEVRAPLAEQPGDVETDETGIGLVALDAVPVAYAIHEGPYDEVGEVYDVIAEWVQANAYALAGPPEEVYLNGPDDVASEQELLTEVRFPIARP